MSAVCETPPYLLLPWIDKSLLVCEYLAGNPLAGDFFEENPSMIRYNRLLAANPSAFDIIVKSPEKFGWGWTSANPLIMDLLLHNEYAPVSYSMHDNSDKKKISFDELFSKSNLYWESFDEAFPSICRELKNIFSIDWRALSGNSRAVPILVNNLPIIYLWEVSKNKSIVPIFQKYIEQFPLPVDKRTLEQFNWSYMSANSAAIQILLDYPEYIDYAMLSANENPQAMHLLESNMSKADWAALSANPSAGTFLKEYPELIVWSKLSENPCDIALTLLEASPDRIYWPALSGNPASRALALLSKNLERIDWGALSLNPGIFENRELNLAFSALVV